MIPRRPTERSMNLTQAVEKPKEQQVMEELDEQLQGSSFKSKDIISKIICVLAVALGAFHLYTSQFGTMFGIKQRAVHLTVVLVIAFLMRAKKKSKALNILFAFLSFAAGTYIFIAEQELSLRIGVVYPIDIVFCVIMIAMLLIATKHLLGWPLPIIASVCLLYIAVGKYLPAPLNHRGYSLSRVTSYMFLQSDGIWGSPIATSATIIAIFILFGAFLKHSGATTFFTNLSLGAFGHIRGGPAKVAIVASCLFGSISGSAVANVAGTGCFTIPLMKKTGYEAHFAGAVEAVASSGGQFMPPVMGAAAFMIAEMTGTPYIQIAGAALIPAILYYLALFIQVDLEAVRVGLVGIPKEELPNPKEVFKKGWYLLLPLIMLLFLLIVVKWSALKAGFWSIVAIILISMVNKETRIDFKKFLKALEEGALGMLEVACACGIAGIVVGTFGLTGLGLKFSNFLVALSGGHLPVLLVLTMIASLILGMGMATLPAYLILAVLVAPALSQMGVSLLAAHLFIFYFGIISAITPPVAVASYTAAGIAQCSPNKVGFTAWRLGLSAFLLPYMFVFGPPLIMQGTVSEIILAAISSIIGITALSMALAGICLGKKINFFQRVLLFFASLLLVYPGLVTDLCGFAIILVTLSKQIIERIHVKKKAA